eukprot:179159-Chlamydomonas_euryale.AAC.3
MLLHVVAQTGRLMQAHTHENHMCATLVCARAPHECAPSRHTGDLITVLDRSRHTTRGRRSESGLIRSAS